jgi:hypothetical protein
MKKKKLEVTFALLVILFALILPNCRGSSLTIDCATGACLDAAMDALLTDPNAAGYTRLTILGDHYSYYYNELHNIDKIVNIG